MGPGVSPSLRAFVAVAALLVVGILAGSAKAGTFTKVGDEIVFTDPAADLSVNSIEVISVGGLWVTDHSENYAVDPSAGCDTEGQPANSVPAGWYSSCPMTSFRAFLGGGNDQFGVCTVFGCDPQAVTIPVAVFGEEGSDTLAGGGGPDVLNGWVGNDTISGLGGRDRLVGWADTDTLNGGDGSDLLDGGLNNDTMNGGNGVDIVTYAGRTDAITVHLGVAGADDGAALDGAAAARDNINETDVEGVIGGNSGDSLWGDARTDALRIQGGPGNDTLRGGSGPNVMLGNAGNDNIAGGNDLDFFGGGIGNDVINAVDSNSDDVDCGGGVDAASSDAVDAREGCEPNTTITQKPAKTTTQRSATFKYTSTTPGATFQCQHDGGAWLACPTTGKTYSRLRPGTHRFKVRAKDADGTVDPTPASYTWTVR